MRARTMKKTLVTALGVVIAWAAADIPMPGAFGESLPSALDTSADTTETSTTTTTTSLSLGVPETGVEELDETVAAVVVELESATGPLPGEGDDQNDHEDPSGGEDPGDPAAEDPGAEDPGAEEPGGEQETEQPAASGSDPSERGPAKSLESSDEPVTSVHPAIQSGLEFTRILGGQPAPEEIPLTSLLPVPFPTDLIDYVDVPAGPRSTRDVIDRLREAGAGDEQIADVLAPFPVAGPGSYGNDWGAPRHGPGPIVRRHEGTDIFGPRGTPVISSSGGVVTGLTEERGLGGTTVSVTAPNGDRFYYAHLDEIAPGLTMGAAVEVGDSLGTVGTTGNAAGGVPHLHFEIHPGGGEAVPPLPYLDRWLLEARQEAAMFAGAPQPAGVGSFSVPRPSVVATPAPQFIEPAAATASPAATSATALGMLFAGAVAIRRRFLYGRVLPRLPWHPLLRRRQEQLDRLLPFPLDVLRRLEADHPASVDVLEPFLGERRQREAVESPR